MFSYTAKVLGLLSLAVPTVLAAAAGSNLDARAKCNADNCYRALQETTGRYSTRGGTLDCSSLLVTTVTPATSTVYSTLSFTTVDTSFATFTTPVTVVETATATTTVVPIQVNKRAVNTVAPWASSFCGPDVTARFSSACSCLGVTSTVVTAATPSTTVYVSVSATITTVTTASTETSLTTSTATTTSTVIGAAPPPVCGKACTIPNNSDFRSPCAGTAAADCGVCNIRIGAGFTGTCQQCIAGGNYCGISGPTTNCCSGYCSGFSCSY